MWRFAWAEGGHPSTVQMVKLEVPVPTARGLWGRNKNNELLLVECWKEMRKREREVSVDEWDQDVRLLQSSNTSEKLLWFAVRRLCAHIKGSIKRSINCLAVNVARAIKAAIKVTSSHFREAFSWIYNAYCLVFVIELEIKYFNIKGGWSIFCFYFMDKILISIEFYA